LKSLSPNVESQSAPA